ncbi:hypothetical protein [Litorimonas sp. WD9-15]|uniref:hypothetical protein n=1 Tax=Litorimonas sp. WD9-15 TaxID=3418716 RepID=UPI003D069838
MALRENGRAMTSDSFDKLAYVSAGLGAFILLILHVSGVFDGFGMIGTIIKCVIAIGIVAMFSYFKSRGNKLRGLN